MPEKDTRANIEGIVKKIQTAESGRQVSDIVSELDLIQIITTPIVQQALIERAHDIVCQCKRSVLLGRDFPNLHWIAQVPEIIHTPCFQSFLRLNANFRNDITNSFCDRLEQPIELTSQTEILLLELSRLPILAENTMKKSETLNLQSLGDAIKNLSNPIRIITRLAGLGKLMQYPTILFGINSRAEDIVEAIKSKTSLEITRSLVHALLVLGNRIFYKDDVKELENIGLNSTIVQSLFSKIGTKIQKKSSIKKIMQTEDSGKIRDLVDRMILNLGWPYTRLALADIAKDTDYTGETASIIAGSMSPLGVIDVGLVLHSIDNGIWLPTEIISSALGQGSEYIIEIHLLEQDGITAGFDVDCHKFDKLIAPERIKADYLQNSRTGLILSEAIYRRPGVLQYLIESEVPEDRIAAKTFLESIITSNTIPSHLKKNASQIFRLFQ
ncbi:MAG: hypothetical protein P1Q69_14395 [Candidatus Thorarchaeota archaeon]|nr:hypothetical protein [Candidatus Thorarchaeota archaeon]